MKIILLSLLVLSGVIVKAQNQNSQASQVITFRLQPVSLIDFSAAETNRQTKHADSKEDMASSMHDIVINRNNSSKAALPATTLQNEEKPDYKHALTLSMNASEPVYTFSSR